MVMTDDGAVEILGISGSPRRGSNSERIVDAVLAAAAHQGKSCAHVRLRDYVFGSCTGCEACRKTRGCTGLLDGMQILYPLIERARGLVLVSPVHTYNVSGLMKKFIDRLYCYYDFTDERPRGWASRLAGQGRRAVVGCVAEQESEENLGVTLPAMTMPLASHDYEIVGELSVLGVFDAGLVRRREDVLAKCAVLGRDLASSF